MARTRSATDLFRPLVAPGGTLEGLSLPQHEPNKLAHAVQRQKVRPETAPATMAWALKERGG
jgi:hypothetical protein